MNQFTPFIFEGKQVRTLLIDNKPYFVGKDVADVLGYKNGSRDINTHVDDEDKLKYQIGTAGQMREQLIITESGVYSLILSSKLPAAKRFKHWVTSDVLPSIRREGAYVTPQTAYEWMAEPDNMIKFLEKYKSAQQEVRRLHDENQVMQPKALFADAVSVSSTSILVGDLAKLLKQNGVDIGANRLFQWLRDKHYLISQKGTGWNMPTQRAMELELFKVKETSIQHADGHVTVNKTPKVTGKGQQYFINKFLNDEQSA